MTDISFSIANTFLQGKLFTPDKVTAPSSAVLFLHGWTSKQDRYFDFANALAAQGYFCMTFDMRGHGASGGDINVLTRSDFLNDAASAYDFLADVEGVNSDDITIAGSSFGGYVATLLSEKRPCAALCLRVPANYPDSGFEAPHYQRAYSYYEGATEPEPLKWKSTVHPYTETVSLRALHEFGGPVLIVESENDELVPHEVLQSYADAVIDKSKLTYVVMKGALHSLSKDTERQKEFEDILLNWIRVA